MVHTKIAIKTPSDLQNIKTHGHYYLENDIDLKKLTWTPIGSKTNPFTGTLNGNNKTIKNLYIKKQNANYIGLFSSIEKNAIISNLTLKSTNIIGKDGVGTLAGENKGKIYTVQIINTNINTEGDWTGGLVGANYGNINNSYSNGNINSSGKYIGGLVGWNYKNIQNSYSETNTTATGYYPDVGGLIGSNYGTIQNCYATGKVIGKGNFVSGFVGHNEGNIQNCYFDKHSTGQIKKTPATSVSTKNNIIKIHNTIYDNIDTINYKNNTILFKNWNFNETWKWLGNKQWPILQVKK